MFRPDGRAIYGTFCAACHGLSGEGMGQIGVRAFPALANPDFLSVASDEFIRETVRRGRPGRDMPAWQEQGGLRPDEIDAVVSHLRTLSGGVRPGPDVRPARWVRGDAAAGETLYKTYCARCHGAGGIGGEGPALVNPVLLDTATDTFLVETIRRGRTGTLMRAFAVADPDRPALTPADIEGIVAFLRRRGG
jgi:cytochrome c oxidase cbb3-type subunit 3